MVFELTDDFLKKELERFDARDIRGRIASAPVSFSNFTSFILEYQGYEIPIRFLGKPTLSAGDYVGVGLFSERQRDEGDALYVDRLEFGVAGRFAEDRSMFGVAKRVSRTYMNGYDPRTEKELIEEQKERIRNSTIRQGHPAP